MTSSTLGEVATFLSGGTPSKANSAYWNGPIPWLTPKDMSNYNGSTQDTVTLEAIGNGTRLAPEHSLFIAVRGMSLHNEIRVVAPKRAMAFNQDIKALVPQNIDPDFLFYAITSQIPYLLSRVGAAGHGTGVLSTDILKQLPIARFGVAVERQIGQLFAALDKKIDLNRRANETLEGMAQALFRDWFVDFGPVRRKLAGAPDPVTTLGGLISQGERAKKIAALFPDHIGEHGLPDGWNLRPLSTLANIQLKTINPQLAPDEIYEHFSIPAYDKSQMPTVDLGREIKSNKTLIGRNSVLLSKLNPETARVWLPTPRRLGRQICSTEFLVYQPSRLGGLAFLYALFKSDPFRNLLMGMVTGTSKSHQRVSPKALSEQQIAVPPIASIQAYEELAMPLFQKALLNRSEMVTLAETRDLLLPRLMSGEVRVGAGRESA